MTDARERRGTRKSDFRGTRKWRTKRLTILRRDSWTCHWCGQAANEADHVVPVSQGGAWWEDSNLVASCGPCNRARPPSRDWVRSQGASRLVQRHNSFTRGQVADAPRFFKGEAGQDMRSSHISLPLVASTTSSGGGHVLDSARHAATMPHDAPGRPQTADSPALVTADYSRREAEDAAG